MTTTNYIDKYIIKLIYIFLQLYLFIDLLGLVINDSYYST
jgi:hypothetical protein